MVPMAGFWRPKFWQAWKREVWLIERGRANSAHFAPPPSFSPPYPPQQPTEPYWAVSSISWMSHIGAGLLARRRIALLCLMLPSNASSCMPTCPPPARCTLHQVAQYKHFPPPLKVRKSGHSRNSTAMHEATLPKLCPGENPLSAKVLRRLKRGHSTFWEVFKPKCVQPPPFPDWVCVGLAKDCDTFSWPECEDTMFGWLPGSEVLLEGAREVSLQEVPLSLWLSWCPQDKYWFLIHSPGRVLEILVMCCRKVPGQLKVPMGVPSIEVPLSMWSPRCPQKDPFNCSQTHMYT